MMKVTVKTQLHATKIADKRIFSFSTMDTSIVEIRIEEVGFIGDVDCSEMENVEPD
jgi:hypothetical protein